MNMLSTIVPKSDQMNADDLIGANRTITITEVSIPGGDQPVTVHFDGDNGRPFKPCKVMRRVMVKGWGLDATAYAGKSMTLYRDEKVKWGGAEVGGIRISHMSDIDGDFVMSLAETRGVRKPVQILLLEKPKPAEKKARETPAQATDRLVARVKACESEEALLAITGDDRLKIWRSGLTQELEDRIAAAIGDRYSELTSFSSATNTDDAEAA